MSLILEALKKSERERRLGEAPSIGSPVMVVRRRRSRLPLLAGLIVVALVAGWWLRREVPTASSPEGAMPSAPAADRMASAPAAVAPGASAPASRPAPERAQGSADARLPRSKVPPDANAALPAELREKVKTGEVVVANPNLLVPGKASTIKESEAVERAASPAAGVPPASTQKSVALGEQKAPTAAEQKAAAATGAPLGAPAPASSMPAAAVAAPPVVRAPGSVMLLWELPYAKRREIPELKVTMHVYADEPAQRFVIVNGDRHVEGDDLEGLKIVEIRGDGIVLEFHGDRFLYPRGGR